MKFFKFRVLILSLLLVVGNAEAGGFENCSISFLNGRPPVVDISLLKNSSELCSTGHASLFSSITKTPLFSASFLSVGRLASASDMDRVDSFKEDNRLPYDSRSNLGDFVRSGYDRGHLAPNSDMGDREQQSDSFLLTNMIPQNPDNNRHLWANIERVTRSMAKEKGGAYVVTGGAFIGDTVSIGNGVYVPTHVFKAVYFPKTRESSVWFAKNAAGNNYEVISVVELNKRIGIDPFPSLSVQVKSTVVEFDPPKKFKY